uniref:Uncharacterized protein n=1 Tax=Arundo donax TaxID=35708 RepID=A0A0A9A233_ARUDO
MLEVTLVMFVTFFSIFTLFLTCLHWQDLWPS